VAPLLDRQQPIASRETQSPLRQAPTHTRLSSNGVDAETSPIHCRDGRYWVIEPDDDDAAFALRMCWL